MNNANEPAYPRTREFLKTIECYNRLPEEFIVDDVMKCFRQGVNTAKSKIKCLLKDGAVVKSGVFIENGTTKAKYKKKAILVLTQVRGYAGSF